MSPLLRFTGVLEVAIETVRSEIDIFVPQRVFSTLYLPSSTSDENLGRSRSAEKHMRIVLMMKGLEGPNTQDKAERFMVATGHYLEDVMATCPPPCIAGEVGGKSSNTQWAFRQLWRKIWC